MTFSTKEHWCRACTAEADRAKSPSSPVSKKPPSPLTVSPPKPPRANDTADSEGLGLTPSTDKSQYAIACSEIFCNEIYRVITMTGKFMCLSQRHLTFADMWSFSLSDCCIIYVLGGYTSSNGLSPEVAKMASLTTSAYNGRFSQLLVFDVSITQSNVDENVAVK